MIRQHVIEHVLFIVLGVFAICLFEERLVADSGYYIFRVINNESFWVEHHRYILVFSQWIPFIGVKLGLGLKTVLHLYSIGHVVFFYGIFLIAKYGYKNDKAGILLLLLQTLGIMSGFFVPMFELYYCAGFLVLVSTILPYSNHRINLLILGILCFFILTGHPFSFMLLLFIIALSIERSKLEFLNFYLLVLAMMIGLFIFKRFSIDEYEQGRINVFLGNLKNSRYDIPYLKSLVGFLIEYYKELLFIELITITHLLISKEFLKTILAGFAFLGSLVLINLANHGIGHSRYQEQVYFILSFIAAYPFVIYMIRTEKEYLSVVSYFVAVIIVCIRISGIYHDGERFFSKRVEEIQHNISRTRSMIGSKFIIDERDLKYDANWSYPIETMLFSSYESNQNTVTICTDRDMNFHENKSKLLPDQYLFRRWEIYDVETLNNKYFKLDNSCYSTLKTNHGLPTTRNRFFIDVIVERGSGSFEHQAFQRVSGFLDEKIIFIGKRYPVVK